MKNQRKTISHQWVDARVGYKIELFLVSLPKASERTFHCLSCWTFEKFMPLLRLKTTQAAPRITTTVSHVFNYFCTTKWNNLIRRARDRRKVEHFFPTSTQRLVTREVSNDVPDGHRKPFIANMTFVLSSSSSAKALSSHLSWLAHLPHVHENETKAAQKKTYFLSAWQTHFYYFYVYFGTERGHHTHTHTQSC